MEIAAHIDVLEAAGPRLSRAARAAGLDTGVPTCPGWTVRDLIQHLGRVHRWAMTIVRDAVMDRAAPRQAG